MSVTQTCFRYVQVDQSALPSNNKGPTQKKRELKWKVGKELKDQYEVAEEEWDVGEREHWSPLDYFEQYYNDDFWTLVSEQSNIKAMQQLNSINLKSTTNEYKQLIGASIITGCLRLPRLRMYYRSKLRIPAVTQLPRDRFFRLRNYMHFVDNLIVSEETKQKNKLWKVQPIIDAFKNKSLKLPLSVRLSVDEQILPFHGTTSLKQFVKGKPNPVGLKIFILASPNGLVLDFVVYEGASTWSGGQPNKDLGVAGTVVDYLLQRVPPGHTVFVDRYFTSINLLNHLLERKITAVGTIVSNRLPRKLKKKIEKDNVLKNKGRGSFQELVREDDKIGIVKWMDNRSVLMASTKHMAEPVHDVKRYDKKEKKYVLVPRPFVIEEYNRSMGGVDLADRLIAYYRISMRTKKWPVRFCFHFVDMAITNSWIEYRQDRIALGMPKKSIMDLLDFKVYIGESLAYAASGRHSRTHDSPKQQEEEDNLPSSKRKRPTELPTRDRRLTGNDHLPLCSVTDKNAFMRCRNPGCTGKTRFKCVKCDIFLCITPERQCFFEFHT